MKDLLHQIIHKRKFLSVDKLLNLCTTESYKKVDDIYCSYKQEHRHTRYAMFHIMNNKITVYYNIFIAFGMDKGITKNELENYLYEKFITRNKIQ